MVKLSALGERALIQRIAAVFGPPSSPGVEGIGDDCAVLPLSDSESLLVSTDLLAGGVHFLADRIPADDLGWKSLAVNLSDIAAMGGAPLFALLSFALPADTESSWIERFLSGFRELAMLHAVSLIGGDTTASRGEPFVCVTILGQGETKSLKRRSGAQPGDRVFVTGTLGDSRGGLRAVLEGRSRETQFETLVRRHYRPEPPVREGIFLGDQRGVRAMMDISDGLRSDLTQLAAASHCGARIDMERIPVSDELVRASTALGFDASDIAAAGGEDYRLLITVDPDAEKEIAAEFERRFAVKLRAVGEMTDEPGVVFLRGGKQYSPKDAGFEHFG
jgi:thiamine-monophosphate kinase